MTQIHWLNPVNADFNTAADWTGLKVPGAADDAILDAAGAAFVVTASMRETVSSIQTASNATLSITGGTFTALDGTGGGANAGLIAVGHGAIFTVGGAFANRGTVALGNGGPAANLAIGSNTTLTGGGTVSLGTALLNRISGATASTVLDNVDNTITGSGFIGLSRLTLINGAKGIVDASGGTIVLRTTGETVSNTGLLEGTAGGHLNLQNTTVNNAGGGIIAAAAGSTVGLQGATLIGGVL